MIEARWRDTKDPREKLEDLARNLRSFAAAYPSITLRMDARTGLSLAGVIEAVLKVRAIDEQTAAERAALEQLLREEAASIAAARSDALKRIEFSNTCMNDARAALKRAQRAQIWAVLLLISGLVVYLRGAAFL